MRIFTGFVLAAVFTGAAAQPQYEVVDLTKMFGEELTAVDINNNGVVVGHMRLSSTEYQACIIENGKLTMLPMYQGVHDWYPIGIGDNGDVLGAGLIGKPYGYSSLLYRNGKVIDIGITGHQNFPGSFGINNTGHVTGFLGNTPFIWDDGNVTTIPGGGTGRAINDSDQIAGTRGTRATTWINGKAIDLHPAWADDSFAASINAKGEIAGDAWRIAGGQRGVLWQNGKAIDLGDFGGGQSRAYDVNDLSQVVGWASMAGQPDEGFLWENETMYRLTNYIGEHPGFLWLEAAFSINNRSQILTTAAGGTQVGHQLLLNPVPEPTTTLTIICGILSIAVSRRKGRHG
ncbi:MAG: hypothetical protein M3R13_09510 [Armatimonadota bacterium]|nr:hypothetical protein [Armatimonadota bacterium]